MKIARVVWEHHERLLYVDKDTPRIILAPECPDLGQIITKLAPRDTLAGSITALEKQHGSKTLATADLVHVQFLRPFAPPEVWGCGVTYLRQALEHDQDLSSHAKDNHLYHYVYQNKRVEVFFKGLARTMVGPDEPLRRRQGSRQILPESELVLVFDSHERVVGVTLGNDLTAWDIERECPLYLNLAKIWNGSGAFGPFISTLEDVDLRAIKLGCRVIRDNRPILESVGFTGDMKRTIEELVANLTESNAIAAGTLLFTGTPCIIPHDFSLEPGDTVIVTGESLGELRNPIV